MAIDSRKYSVQHDKTADLSERPTGGPALTKSKEHDRAKCDRAAPLGQYNATLESNRRLCEEAAALTERPSSVHAGGRMMQDDIQKKTIVGNWKMHTTCSEARDLAQEIVDGLVDKAIDEESVSIILGPPFPYHAAALLSRPGIDGALLGGASLVANEFSRRRASRPRGNPKSHAIGITVTWPRPTLHIQEINDEGDPKPARIRTESMARQHHAGTAPERNTATLYPAESWLGRTEQ